MTFRDITFSCRQGRQLLYQSKIILACHKKKIFYCNRSFNFIYFIKLLF